MVIVITVIDGDADDSPEGLLLDGASMQTKADLIRVFAKELGFPDYWQANWDSFEECLNDAGLSASVPSLTIKSGDLVLMDSKTDLATFVDILRLAEQSMPLVTILLNSPVDLDRWRWAGA